MSIRVQLSYEERIINALSCIHHKRNDDVLTRMKKEFDAIREVLKPLYEELKELRNRGINDNRR